MEWEKNSTQRVNNRLDNTLKIADTQFCYINQCDIASGVNIEKDFLMVCT